MTEAAMIPTPNVGAEIRSARSHLFRRILRNGTAVTALVILAIVVLAAIFAPLLTGADPNRANIRDLLAAPGSAHPLGADAAGRDVLARLLYGTRFSLAGALLATAIAAVLGVATGLIAGYYQKWFENVSSWVVSVVMALPGIVVLLAARAVLGPSLWLAMGVFGILMAPAFY
jgi:peptide/nickel transport system permease protein